MIFIVIIIFGLLLFFVLGTDSFRKYAKKVSRKRRQNKLENNEPLKGYEKCSPQYQAYMRKQIAAGKAKPKTKTQEEEEKEIELKKQKEKKDDVHYGPRGGVYRYKVRKNGELYRDYY